MFPWAAIPAGTSLLRWARDRQQSRRKVSLTVHRAFPVTVQGGQPTPSGPEHFYVNVTNRSHERSDRHARLVRERPARPRPRPRPPEAARLRRSLGDSRSGERHPASPEQALWLAR